MTIRKRPTTWASAAPCHACPSAILQQSRLRGSRKRALSLLSDFRPHADPLLNEFLNFDRHTVGSRLPNKLRVDFEDAQLYQFLDGNIRQAFVSNFGNEGGCDFEDLH